MKKVWGLALITYREGIRNRSLFGIFLFALFISGLNIAVAGFFMRDVGKVAADMNLSALSFAGLLLVFFIGLNLLAKDIDKKTIHLVLSKPISRTQYVWGKYLGIELFLLVSLGLLFGVSCLTVFALGHLYSEHFGRMSWNIFFLAGFFIFVKISVLNAVVVFFSTITTSSFITLVFSICTYIAGVSIEEVVFFLKSQLGSEVLTASEPLLNLIEKISYIIPNLSAFDFKLEAAHGLAVSFERIFFSLGYAGVYIGVLLLLGSLIFRRREFV